MVTPRPESAAAADERQPDEPVDPLRGTTLADLESMRLLLFGQSVIDWHQLAFQSEAEVDRFLRVNEFDPQDTMDMDRLEELRIEAVEYLTRHFEYRIPDDVAGGVPARDLPLLASRKGRHQTYACIVLKVMHVLHHLDGREILFRLPVSDDQVFGLVEQKVVHVVDEIRGAGFPIAEFAWSRKPRDSLIAKLLAKRDSIAAHVYDKLRFRLVTRRREDLPGVLRELLHRLVPFNYIIPGETLNRLLHFRKMVEDSPHLRGFQDKLQSDIDSEESTLTTKNDFSGPGYRNINFVADLPVRISALENHLPAGTLHSLELNPRAVIFVLTEFQVVDADTARDNELGENSHEAYKERQKIMIKARLTRGMRNRLNRSG